MSHPLAKSLRRLARTVFGQETLPPPDPEPVGRGADGGRPGLARLLFAPEPLPLDPELPRRRSRWLAWLFLPERLDRGPQRPPVD